MSASVPENSKAFTKKNKKKTNSVRDENGGESSEDMTFIEQYFANGELRKIKK